MSRLLTLGLRWQGRPLMQRLEAATKAPAAAQQVLLQQLLSHHATTQFGQAHQFAAIRTPADYRRAAPIRDYEDFRPQYCSVKPIIR